MCVPRLRWLSAPPWLFSPVPHPPFLPSVFSLCVPPSQCQFVFVTLCIAFKLCLVYLSPSVFWPLLSFFSDPVFTYSLSDLLAWSPDRLPVCRTEPIPQPAFTFSLTELFAWPPDWLHVYRILPVKILFDQDSCFWVMLLSLLPVTSSTVTCSLQTQDIYFGSSMTCHSNYMHFTFNQLILHSINWFYIQSISYLRLYGCWCWILHAQWNIGFYYYFIIFGAVIEIFLQSNHCVLTKQWHLSI